MAKRIIALHLSGVRTLMGGCLSYNLIAVKPALIRAPKRREGVILITQTGHKSFTIAIKTSSKYLKLLKISHDQLVQYLDSVYKKNLFVRVQWTS